MSRLDGPQREGRYGVRWFIGLQLLGMLLAVILVGGLLLGRESDSAMWDGLVIVVGVALTPVLLFFAARALKDAAATFRHRE